MAVADLFTDKVGGIFDGAFGTEITQDGRRLLRRTWEIFLQKVILHSAAIEGEQRFVAHYMLHILERV